MEDQIGSVLVLSGALRAGDLILSKTVCPLAGVYSVLHDKGGIIAACAIGGGDGGGGFVRASASAVQSVVLKNQRLMEELNQRLRRRFQMVSLRNAFLQGYTNDLLYQLTWRDPESSKQIFQLLLDILPGEA